MSTQAGPPERGARGASGSGGTRLPAMARYWWLTALRGLVALLLALAIAVAGRSTARLVSFLALFWLTGGLITLRFALAIRPRPGFRLECGACMPPDRRSRAGLFCSSGSRSSRGTLAAGNPSGITQSG